MAALVCDLCGGKLVMGAGGIATCDSCGMEHSADRMKEKVQEIKGTVRVDNTHMIDNYLEMAQSAKDAGNNAEAESYCNKIIEIDPANYRAWMLKGEAAAWQSSLQNSRVDEGVAAFIKGINNAPEEEKENLGEWAKEQIIKLSTAMISLRADRFVKWPDEEEATGFISDITSILNTVVTFLSQTGVLIPLSDVMSPIATLINQSVVEAWQNVIWPDYNGDPNDSDDRAGKYEWQNFIKRVEYCTSLVERAISLCDEDDEDDIQRYENLIFIHKAAIYSCSWDYNFTDRGKSWHEEWMLTDEAKNARRALIRGYEQKISAIKKAKADKEAAERAEKERIEKEEAQKRFDAYWSTHADEKAALEKEKDSLTQQINAFNQEINEIPGSSEVKQWQDTISHLTAEKSSLGLFKGKEKKALQEKIDEANTEIKIIQDRMAKAKAEIQQKIKPLQDRVSAITTELTKAR